MSQHYRTIALLTVLFLCIFVHSESKWIKNLKKEANISQNSKIQKIENWDTSFGRLGSQVITPGHGYCTDTQQVSPVKCFEVKTPPISQASSIVHFDSGMNFDDISREFKIDVKSKVRIWMWGGSFAASYFRSIQDTDFSMSVHYYAMLQGTVTMEIGYGPDSALSKDGKAAYMEGKNPNFNLICGDQAITEYKAGASLTLSMQLEFRNHVEKNAFSTAIGASFGPFFKLSTSVQAMANKVGISGKVIIHGYQQGGNPSQLGRILGQKCGDHYCASACDMSNMAACQSAVDGLIKYASESFPNQVNFEQNRGLSSYPVGFASLTSIKLLGLLPAKTYVSDEVIAARIKLGQALTENKYYYDKLTEIMFKYPGTWNKFSAIYTKLDALYKRVSENMRLLNDDQDGAIGCYYDPESCVQIANILMAQLGPIDTSDWSWMNQAKSKLNVLGSFFYRTGDAPSELHMILGYNPGAARIIGVYSISWGPTDLAFKIQYDTGDHFSHKHVIYTTIGSLKSSDQCHYVGKVDNDYGDGHQTDPIGCSCYMSEYYFTPYIKLSEQEQYKYADSFDEFAEKIALE